MKDFLILFEEIPDSMKIFHLQTDDLALIERIRQCHNQFANSEEIDPDIKEFISNIDKLPSIEELDISSPVVLDCYCEIIMTGMIL